MGIAASREVKREDYLPEDVRLCVSMIPGNILFVLSVGRKQKMYPG